MIARLKGKLVEVALTEVIVDVNGVGYQVYVPMSTYDRLPLPGKDIELLTSMQVREDSITLYGFATMDEKNLFGILVSVSGIGARMALNILSCMSVKSFCGAISSGDTVAIKRINGVGKKMAERLIVELKDKIDKLVPEAAFGAETSDGTAKAAEDAMLALEQLGIKRDKSRAIIMKLVSELPEKECSSENLIRKALQAINS